MTATMMDEPVEDFLISSGIGFSVRWIGSDCPAFCPDRKAMLEDVGKFPRKTHIHGEHWLATFEKDGGKTLSVDYWDSYNDAEFRWLRKIRNSVEAHSLPYSLFHKHGMDPDKLIQPKIARDKRIPTAYDVLSAVEKHDPGDFEEFCGNFGYDEDSRKAEQTWRAVVEEWRKVRDFFSEQELETLQEIAV